MTSNDNLTQFKVGDVVEALAIHEDTLRPTNLPCDVDTTHDPDERAKWKGLKGCGKYRPVLIVSTNGSTFRVHGFSGIKPEGNKRKYFLKGETDGPQPFTINAYGKASVSYLKLQPMNISPHLLTQLFERWNPDRFLSVLSQIRSHAQGRSG